LTIAPVTPRTAPPPAPGALGDKASDRMPDVIRIILVSFLLVYAGGTAYSCSCDGIPTIQEEFEQSDIVFAGRIADIVSVLQWDFTVPQFDDTATFYYNKWAVYVESVWKGTVADTLYVYSGLGGGDCGVRFTPGSRYIIYGWMCHESMEQICEDKPEHEYPFYLTGICNRTKSIDAAASDLKQLPAPIWKRCDQKE